jgi:hypothetical protein
MGIVGRSDGYDGSTICVAPGRTWLRDFLGATLCGLRAEDGGLRAYCFSAPDFQPSGG